ncbi:arylsulfatase [Planctomycetota bacterium]
MDRRDFLKAAGASAATLAATGCQRFAVESSAKKRPNVILVMTDDQGYGDLACHGNPVIRTPNLDALHAQSIRLTDFHVDPTCAPTRAALMTGRYSIRTGVWHTLCGRSFLRRDEVTMADVFSGSGYRTAIFGKWNLGNNYPFRPQDRGFEEVFITGDDGTCFVGDYWGNDRFDDVFWHNGKPEKSKGYCTDVLFNKAMEFMEADKERPFFCYLPTNAAHRPWSVEEKYVEPYRGNEKVPHPDFYGTIGKIDENIGRLMNYLKTSGLEENTILIFMTDNGSPGKGFNAGMRDYKVSCYDGGHRVPCFIRWPAGELYGGKDIHRLTAHIDLLPTLIELCRLRKPEKVKFDGTSLVPLLAGKTHSWPDRALVVDSQRIEHPEKWRKNAVMTDRWRMINGKELYDIKADPGQQNDIAGQDTLTVGKLRKVYEDWWADVSERFDEYCEIIIGSEQGNIFPLTGDDWHEYTGSGLWRPQQVMNGNQTNGFWAVEVARDGMYEFALRRWPRELDKPITSGPAGAKVIIATRARLKIADLDVTGQIPKDAAEVLFRVKLKAGKTRLQTWFLPDQSRIDSHKSRGAYYVYVKRLP